MKLLLIGLFPVVVFWFVEDKFGTFWGLIAAIVWAFLECAYEYIRNKQIDRLTLISTAFVVVLGGLGAWLDQSAIFKFQPVIMELVFAGVLIWGGRGGEPMLLKLAKKTRPEVFAQSNEVMLERQKHLMIRLTRNLLVVLVVHSALLAYLALYSTTGQWAFWKGIGFNVFILFWMGGEIIILRLKMRGRK
jgi:intracellular septation protein A